MRRLGLVAGRDSEDGDGQKYKLVKDPLVEAYALQCDSPVTAMALGTDHILAGCNNAKVSSPLSGMVFTDMLKVLMWDKRSQSKLKSLERHKNSIRSLCLRYPHAMSGSRDKTALLWDLEKG